MFCNKKFKTSNTLGRLGRQMHFLHCIELSGSHAIDQILCVVWPLFMAPESVHVSGYIEDLSIQVHH